MLSDIEQAIQDRRLERERLDQVIRSLEEALAAEQGASNIVQAKKPTYTEMAQSILQEEQRTMHTMELTNKIQERFGVRTKPRSLGTMLHRAAGTGRVFVKDLTAKNTYGLLDWTKKILKK